jgi:hypothetical protein
MATGGFEGCVIIWEPYPKALGDGTVFRDKQDRGIVHCQSHDKTIDYGIVRPKQLPEECEHE